MIQPTMQGRFTDLIGTAHLGNSSELILYLCYLIMPKGCIKIPGNTGVLGDESAFFLASMTVILSLGMLTHLQSTHFRHGQVDN